MVSWPLTSKWTVFFVLWTAGVSAPTFARGDLAGILGLLFGGILFAYILQTAVGKVQSWWRNRGDEAVGDPQPA